MSRFEYESAEWMVAFGADPTTGSFCQVWKQPHDDQDAALIAIDNLGVRTNGEAIEPNVRRLLDTVKLRYEAAERHGNPYPNVDAETVARLFSMFGFPGLSADVHRAFD